MTAETAVVAGARPIVDVLADAVRVLTEAARTSSDWAEFVTLALAGAAANVGSVEAALAGRPGSWEADGVRSLLTSTVGYDEQYLLEHRTEPVRVVLYVDEILYDLDIGLAYDDAARQLAARPATTDAENDALGELEDRLEQQRRQDWQAHGAALEAAVHAAAAQLPGLSVPVSVVVDLDTFRREYDRRPDQGRVEERLLDQARRVTPLPSAWSRSPLERLESTS